MIHTNPSHTDSLTLADGSSWAIVPEDAAARYFADIFAKAMQLRPSLRVPEKKVLLVTADNSGQAEHHFADSSIAAAPAAGPGKPVVFQTPRDQKASDLALQLMRLSLVICNQVEIQGGLLLHGALVEKSGAGIILAGPGEVGKTTACKRLPRPWQPLSDDCTLVVRDQNGAYHAHPWPSWSTFMFGGNGGSWDVQHSVPLQAIFLLARSEKDAVKKAGTGEAVCMINECTDQAWWPLANNFGDEQKRHCLNLLRFNNSCELAKAIPAYLLHLSRDGKFWNDIEMILTKKPSDSHAR
ncbi:MAG: SynChlorMet cassette protein ScmC [Desulfobulbales bacterium]|nr:SynChlorMet cassette protein ScmC [Desulfobulbales bacterium]